MCRNTPSYMTLYIAWPCTSRTGAAPARGLWPVVYLQSL